MEVKGDLDGALTMHRKTLALKEKVNGKEHSSTSITQWKTGHFLEDSGHIDAASRDVHQDPHS